jgi:endonuclease YncB( thermonuclease family)
MKALAFVALLALTSTAAGQDIIGQATVIDGDTIEIHRQRIRLWGIDAPESDQLGGADSELFRCGSAAASGLANHIAGHVVGCLPRATDRYQRVAAFAWPMALIWRGGLCGLGSRLTGRSIRAGLIPRIRRRWQGRARACLPEAFSSSEISRLRSSGRPPAGPRRERLRAIRTPSSTADIQRRRCRIGDCSRI